MGVIKLLKQAVNLVLCCCEPFYIGQDYDEYEALKNVASKQNGLNLIGCQHNKDLLKNWLNIFSPETDGLSVNLLGRILPTIPNNIIDNVRDDVTLLDLINRFKWVYSSIKDINTADRVPEKIKYIKNLLELEYYSIIEERTESKLVTDDNLIDKTNINGQNVEYVDKDGVGNFSKDGHWLWGWNPKVEDIKQGNLGDCYLLSTLLGLIEGGNQDVIKNCFIASDDDTVTIRFYKVKIYFEFGKNIYRAIPSGKIEIKVKKTLSVYANNHNNNFGNQTTAQWVSIFEKAFTVYKSDRTCVTAGNNYINDVALVNNWYSKNKNPTTFAHGEVASVQDIDGGYSTIVMTAITGKSAKLSNMLNRADDINPSLNDLYQFLTTTLDLTPAQQNLLRNLNLKKIVTNNVHIIQTLSLDMNQEMIIRRDWNNNILPQIQNLLKNPMNKIAEWKKFPNRRLDITGAPTDNRYTDMANDLYNKLDKNLKKGKLITAFTRELKTPSIKEPDRNIWTDSMGNHKPHNALIAEHSYAMVIKVEEDSRNFKYIHLRNPHMNDKVEYANGNLNFDQDGNIELGQATEKIQRIDDVNTSPNDKGRVKMELNDFIKYFGNLEIGTVKIKI